MNINNSAVRFFDLRGIRHGDGIIVIGEKNSDIGMYTGVMNFKDIPDKKFIHFSSTLADKNNGAIYFLDITKALNSHQVEFFLDKKLHKEFYSKIFFQEKISTDKGVLTTETASRAFPDADVLLKMGTNALNLGDVDGDGFDDYGISIVGYGEVNRLFWSVEITYAMKHFFDIPIAAQLKAFSLYSTGMMVVLNSRSNYGEISLKNHFNYVDGNSSSVRIIGDINEDTHMIYKIGDINGDGINDIGIAASLTNHRPIYGVCEAPKNYYFPYVPDGKFYFIYGGISLGEIDLGKLSSKNGFVYNPPIGTQGNCGLWSGAADINGDQLNDVFISCHLFCVNGVFWSGSVKIIYGKALIDNFDKVEPDVSISGFNNSRFTGLIGSPGDINGDGIDDVLITTFSYHMNNGRVSVLFGNKNGFKSEFSLENDIDGLNGFHIDGLHKFSTFGQSNCGGDINGDGINDIIICSAGFTSQIRENSGACTIIFGSKEILKSVHNSKFDIINMDTSVGFHVLGLEGDYLGASYGCDRIGDINGDGIDDVVFSSMLSNHEGNGRLYILYGRSTQEWQDSLFKNYIKIDLIEHKDERVGLNEYTSDLQIKEGALKKTKTKDKHFEDSSDKSFMQETEEMSLNPEGNNQASNYYDDL